jgi:tetratricopeptide (TPR) repeat protein
LANSLNNLANVARDQKDFETADQLYRESLQINHSLGDKRAIAFLLEDISALAALQERAKHALTLYAAAAAMREEIGAPLPPSDQEKLDSLLAPARAALDTDKLHLAQAKGEAMTVEEAVTYALNGRHR